MTVLVAATRNEAKLRELRRLVGDAAAIEPLPHDISQQLGASESSESIELNAAAKAVAASRALDANVLTVASDGGLLIPALEERWNPALTRRFAGEAADDVARAMRLLELAGALSGRKRTIGWREAVAIARDGEVIASWSAESTPGELATAVDPATVAAGGGFWVPALWRCPEYGGRLLAGLSREDAEARDDHWRRLAGPVRAWLRENG